MVTAQFYPTLGVEKTEKGKEKMNILENEQPVKGKYVAFCDILGFSAKVRARFEETQQEYLNFIDTLESIEGINLTIYSDSVIIVSESLWAVLLSAQRVCWFALGNNFLVRGGIAYGKHWEAQRGKNFLM